MLRYFDVIVLLKKVRTCKYVCFKRSKKFDNVEKSMIKWENLKIIQ